MEARAANDNPFRHEALVHDGLAGFVEALVPFIQEALEAGEPVLAAAGRDRIRALRDALGADAAAVEFSDMHLAGRNPARLISIWEAFVRAHPEAPAARGIAEPVWPERKPEELIECEQHESLLNLAMAGGPPLRLVCAYDAAALPEDVVAAAGHHHPLFFDDGQAQPSGAYRPPLRTLSWPLPEPGPNAVVRDFDRDGIRALRGFVAERARELGLTRGRVDDLVFAAGELATNSILHGGGRGEARIWAEDGAVVLEVRDAGRIADPLAGRRQPTPEQIAGRGLWLVNQLCDLVQLRSGSLGTAVRVRVGGAGPELALDDRGIASAEPAA